MDLAFYAQHQLEALDPSRSVLDELAAVAHYDDQPRLRAHLGAFLFSGDDVEKKVEVLSGGEKARLALARLLLRPANFLVLDEPTNHLDVESREVLESALSDYAGTLLLISHDRDLLDALCTRVVDVRGGRLESHPGSYADFCRAPDRPGTPEPDPAQAPPASSPPPTPLPTSKQERMAARERARERARQRSRAERRLAEIEEEILGLEERVEELGQQLAEPEVYRDGDFSRAIQAERGQVRQEIEARYADWERAAAELEALNADGDGEGTSAPG